MVRVVVGGATGKLGSLVCERIIRSDDLELAGAVVSPNGGNVGKELYPGVIACGPDRLLRMLDECDVYVDLTSPEAASGIVPDIPSTGANLVIGTTSVDGTAIDRLVASLEEHGTSALMSSNFAPGVNVFWKVCEIMSRYLPGYDIEVIEAHHRDKRDSPSGTTMEAVRRMSSETGINDISYGREGETGPRGRGICVHSIRAGNIVGDHTVMFAMNNEVLELTHKSVSRESFADGCIESIRWIAGKKDGKLHNMNEVLGL